MIKVILLNHGHDVFTAHEESVSLEEYLKEHHPEAKLKEVTKLLQAYGVKKEVQAELLDTLLACD